MDKIATQADRVINKFGGLSPMARALSAVDRGTRKRIVHSTVQRWQIGGYIPARHWERVVDAAQIAGVDLEPFDFVAHLAEILIARREQVAPVEIKREEPTRGTA